MWLNTRFGILGLTCKYKNLLLCKKPLFAQRQTRWHSSLLHRNTAVFCVLGLGYCGRLIQGMFFVLFCFFFYLDSSSFMQPLVFVWQRQLSLLCCNSAEYRAQQEER